MFAIQTQAGGVRHLAFAASRWVQNAGGHVPEGSLVEVSPLISYAGEDLRAHCDGVKYGPGTTQVC